jgi:hypothetical protein
MYPERSDKCWWFFRQVSEVIHASHCFRIYGVSRVLSFYSGNC